MDKNLIDTFNHGKYYVPANSHYNNTGDVSCDRCKTRNIKVCIGYGNTDLCMNCVDIISTIVVPRTLQIPSMLTQIVPTLPTLPTLPTQPTWDPNQPWDPYASSNAEVNGLPTRMEQGMFNPNTKSQQRVRKLPEEQNLTYMEQNMFRDK